MVFAKKMEQEHTAHRFAYYPVLPYLCYVKACTAGVDKGKTVGQSVAVAARQRRKVRAAQSAPLPNRKLLVKAE